MARVALVAPGHFVFAIDSRRAFMKITVTSLKPRNPLVAPAHFRRAGSHQPDGRAMRRQGSRMLRRELERMKQHSP
jgi:hypothetical protein